MKDLWNLVITQKITNFYIFVVIFIRYFQIHYFLLFITSTSQQRRRYFFIVLEKVWHQLKIVIRVNYTCSLPDRMHSPRCHSNVNCFYPSRSWNNRAYCASTRAVVFHSEFLYRHFWFTSYCFNNRRANWICCVSLIMIALNMLQMYKNKIVRKNYLKEIENSLTKFNIFFWEIITLITTPELSLTSWFVLWRSQ